MLLAVHQEGLTAIHWNEAHAILTEPSHRRAGPVDQRPGQVLIGLAARHLHQGFIEELPVMGRQDHFVRLVIRHVDQHILADIIQAVVHETEAASGEIGITALLVLRRFFQHQHPRAILMGRNCGAEGCIARTNYNNVIGRFAHRHTPNLEIACSDERLARPQAGAQARIRPIAVNQTWFTRY